VVMLKRYSADRQSALTVEPSAEVPPADVEG